MNKYIHKIHEFVKDIKYFLDIEKVNTDSLPGLPPVSAERANEISEEVSKTNQQGSAHSPRIRYKGR